MADSQTPLSDLIAQCDASPGAYDRFLEAFLQSEIGVVMTSPGPPPALGSTILPDGRSMVLACADQHVFRVRYGGQFNASMTGRGVCDTVWHNPKCPGVRVNSAASENSIIIPRKRIAKLLGHKPWWRFW